MNCLMGGMLPVSARAFQGNPDAHDPLQPLFWFRMSLALMVGALCAYPMNYWLVAHHLKHGMMTVRPEGQGAMETMNMSRESSKDRATEATKMSGMKMADKMRAAQNGSALHTPSPPVWVMGVVSLAVLAVGVVIALEFAR